MPSARAKPTSDGKQKPGRRSGGKAPSAAGDQANQANQADQISQIVETIIFLVAESRRLAREESSQYGVTPTQLAVIKLLHEVGDLQLGELSKRISAQNSTVTGIVDRMEEAALVCRYRNPDDRRAWRIGLTPRGRELGKRAQAGLWHTLRSALDALPAADQRRLIQLLGQVAGNVAQLTTTGSVKE